jgi:hypothetical protein
MPKSKRLSKPTKAAESKIGSEVLKGWTQIAKFLGQPVSVAERWAKSGMPIEHQGRHVSALTAELTARLGRESAGEPVHIANESLDLSADLKRGLSYVRKQAREKS